MDGRFVGHAIGTIIKYPPIYNIPSNLLSPVVGGLQMVQTHRGFQATYKRLDTIQAALQGLQNSVGVLQATTAVIGVGVAVGVVLSAVNLYHTLKLRKEVEQLRLEVNQGFIDLKVALKDQGNDIITRIDEVGKDIKFEAHKLVLIQAYGKFQEALRLMKTALLIEDISTRNITLGNAQLLLANALADYNNPHLLEQTCAAGHLRRVECAWAIEQTMTLTYQLQNQPAAVSDRLAHLQDKIRQDSLTVVERCESSDELDFLFPEITRIQTHDLAMLQTWENQADWIGSLPPDELKQLNSADFSSSEVPTNKNNTTDINTLEQPPEQLIYDNLKEKSHFISLRDQLKFLIQPELRQKHESYISQQAISTGYKALAPSNWEPIPDLTVANLYWYFKAKAEPAQ
ncbi:hypothetical protein Cri9333_2714 [Crinalium epipsammum PCC 9333]|uniref:Uncharacterized protein n=1 Tax=Crinalium epipsammum PCC 9333 TaxID=1173022 RepID=K9W1B3_9CYAN|nr:hypothetical protein [Crinalium epipsammum]AFZ13569.1 hypothetical protein Cri9333_2714 [Crinalium epipsammum PCC 9333]